jgi:hypothetical protein
VTRHVRLWNGFNWVRMDLRDKACQVVEWIQLGQNGSSRNGMSVCGMHSTGSEWSLVVRMMSSD